ncbi:HAMP domain-containing protein [Neisseriaceae bacterium PsAf]|nr:HAMP domain-containing protein [Neisseriaceae bacterium PsAf]
MRLRNILLFLLVLSGITLYMLSVATGVTSKLSEYFWFILGFNVLIILSLLFVLSKQFWKLTQDVKNGVYGAKLSQSMIKRFTLVAVLPGLFLFAVSTQFISHSINSWFGDGTREALDRSLSLSKVALDNFSTRMTSDAQLTGLKIKYGLSMGQSFENILPGISTDLSKFDQVLVMNKDGDILKTANDPNKLPWPYLAELDWPMISNNPIYTDTTLIGDKLYSEVFLHIYPDEINEYILFFRKKVPDNIASDVQLIKTANQNYAELTYHKEGLQTIFILTLLVSTLLSIFMALLAAVFFSRKFVEPLIALSDSTKAVSMGDFSKRNLVFRDDELGQLSEKFNEMTEQLQLERERSENLYNKQQEARQYFESVLLNLTTGVITLDSEGYIKTYNTSVENILNFSLSPYLEQPWQDWPNEDMHIGFLKAFIHQLLEQPDGKSLEFQYSANDSVQVLLGKAAELEGGKGLVLVFDDVTKLVTAQKEAAWGEVARRLAHEIKNPLTPIQLSAERVQFKLSSKLSETDAQMLKKSTDTIVKQVAALKEMVESFRNYARTVTLNLTQIDLNDLVKEVLLLYEGLDCTFIVNLSNIELPVQVDSTSIRQVLHNVFKNALEAAKEDEHPEVVIESERINGEAVLIVYNNGKSFSQDMIQHAFEPYVTDKMDGTGLGLAVVKKIIEEHGGRVTLSNRKDSVGACVKITLNIVGE